MDLHSVCGSWVLKDWYLGYSLEDDGGEWRVEWMFINLPEEYDSISPSPSIASSYMRITHHLILPRATKTDVHDEIFSITRYII